MSDHELLELCKQHFAFLGKMSQVPKVRQRDKDAPPSKGKWVSSRKVIETECLAAIETIERHFKADQTLAVNGV